MTRLEVLKAEKEQIKSLHCLSFSLIDKCIEWYDKEIEAIVIHDADNKFYGQQAKAQADGDLISRQAVIDAFHHRFLQKGFEKDRWWNSTHVLAAIEGLPSVDIPPEHDGCKGCKYQDKSEDEMPCLECMHNYTDEWQKKPHWNHGVCDNCGYDWGKDAPIASVPNFCPNCGSPMEIER